MSSPDEPFAWLPGNRVDAELASAMVADDRRRFFEIIRAAPWYLPALPADPGGQRFLTRELLGGTYLLVYTSVRSLVSTVGPAVVGYTVTGYEELARRWPEPSWRLAVNPGTPVDAWVTLAALAEAADGTRVVPTLASRRADADPDTDAAVDRFLRALSQGTLLVPTTGQPPAYQVLRRDGRLVVEVYTSPRTLPPGTPYLPAVLADLVLRWPGSDHHLSIDPGSEAALLVPGDRVAGMLLWSAQADDAEPDADQLPGQGSHRIADGEYIDPAGASTERG
jgi:hypothetical protein